MTAAQGRSPVHFTFHTNSSRLRRRACVVVLEGGREATGKMKKRWPSNAAKQQSSSRPVKQRLRGLERLLNKPGLPDEIRKAKEVERAALQADAKRHNRVQRERHFSKKYHGVKFIERRKVERRIASLRRAMSDAGANDDLGAELREAENDLLYIKHFPRSKKYLALFPSEGANDEYIVKRRSQIRARIVRRAEAGLLLGPTDEEDGEEAADRDFDNDLEGDTFFAPGAAMDESETVINDSVELQPGPRDASFRKSARAESGERGAASPAEAEGTRDPGKKSRKKRAGGSEQA
jgi:hypothetical protein